MKKFKTKKHLGQHLLVSEGVLNKIADELEINNNDIVVEIGIGTGQLTEAILKKNPKILYGIEIDKTAYPIIEERFRNYKNFVLIKSDFFKVELKSLSKGKGERIKITGNLPYNVASHIIVKTVENIDIIQLAVFMVQKEVGEKLTAKPKGKNYSFLSVFVQTFFEVRYVMSVPARFFKPPPKVTSAVIKMIPKEKKQIEDIKGYKEFLSNMFANKRKMLKSKISTEILKKAGIKETARAQELSIEDFINLYSVFKKNT